MTDNFENVEKLRNKWLDPGDLFDDSNHDEDCEDENCEGECFSVIEPDYELIIQDRLEYETDRWLDNNGY